MLVLQSPARPSAILSAIGQLVDAGLSRVRIAAAYATLSGWRVLEPQLQARVGDAGWAAVPLDLVTSFDFGLTEPALLRHLLARPNTRIFIANLANVSQGYVPTRTAWHPKVYLFDHHTRSGSLVGSANLTSRALTVNTEVATATTRHTDRAPIEFLWRALQGDAQPLDEELLMAYDEWRRRLPPNPEREDHVVELPPSQTTDVLADAMALGFNPQAFDAFWVEAGSMSSGGSHNQLELPRGANAFFGFAFDDYHDAHAVIGQPLLYARGDEWSDRRLTWHGNNRMERLNLPTRSQGGFAYVGTAVLFRRTHKGYMIEVAKWDDPAAVSWRNASAAEAARFRLGHTSSRTCGFF